MGNFSSTPLATADPAVRGQVPQKQGLKPDEVGAIYVLPESPRASSTKTRIETHIDVDVRQAHLRMLVGSLKGEVHSRPVPAAIRDSIALF